LIKLYNTNDTSNEEKTKRVKEIFSLLQLDQVANNEIDKYFNEGIKRLDSVDIEKTNKEILRDVACRMIDREK